MVHALEQARRVLVPQGILLDLRPYGWQAPLEFLHGGRTQPIAMLDTSSDWPDSLAADRAFESAVQVGLFQPSHTESFDQAYYWDSVADLLVDYNEKWKGDIKLPRSAVRKAARMYQEVSTPARLRIRFPVKLGVYKKRG
jgi:hypothetical protein